MRLALVFLLAMTLPGSTSAAPADPYLWLEEVSSPRAMEWVERDNAVTVKRLEADPRYAKLYDEALAIAGAEDRIPEPSFTHGAIYNFWQDPEHLRGIWRKTTLEQYRAAAPQWTTVLDVDALNKAEGRSFVFKGAVCLHPDEARCLIALSDGGEDAEELREFDLDSGRWVEGGFHLPKSKQTAQWEDVDTLLIAREWTPGDLTTSGYPYIVKRLKRGQPLSAASEVFRGETTDVSTSPQVLHDGQGRSLTLIERGVDFFHSRVYVAEGGRVRRLAIPEKSSPEALVAGRLLVKLEEPWSIAGGRFDEGSLVQLDLAAVKADPAHPEPTLVWRPTARESLDDLAVTRDRLILATLVNVRGRCWIYTPTRESGWTQAPVALPDNASLSLGAADERSNLAFISVSSFLEPSSLRLLDASSGELAEVKRLPAKFDASGLVTEQFEALSTDGTKIPYFVVHRRDRPLDGATPTLLTAYGGF